MPRPPRRDPRGGDFINGPTPRETDVITIPTRYALHSYAKLGAARSWVFTTVRQLTPWDAYFGFNSTTKLDAFTECHVWSKRTAGRDTLSRRSPRKAAISEIKYGPYPLNDGTKHSL